MIQIVIAEDQGMLLGALGSLLNMEEDMEIIGKAQNGEEAVHLVEQLQPDICIMDIEMPVKTGLDAAELLKDNPCKIVILTTFARAGYFERARKAGVRGYLLKDNAIEDLTAAIRNMMENRRVYDPELGDIVDLDEEDVMENRLSTREDDVIKHVSQGKTPKEVADQLYLSHGTVRTYMSIIIEKLHVSNRIEAIAGCNE